MADVSEVPIVTTPAPAVESVTSVPAIDSVSASPSNQSAAPVTEPVVADISTPAEASPAEPIATDLLAAEPKKDETKPAEAKTEEVKPAEEAKPTEEVVIPTYESFKLPDTFKDNADATETVTKFANILGKFETSLKTHEDFQKFGQEATDFYINGVQGALSKQQDYFVQLHQKNITDRIDAVRNDPVLGGKNFEKTNADMIEAVQAYGGNKEQILALRDSMQKSGMGVDPSLVRFVSNMKNALDKYTKEPVSSNVTGTRPQPVQKGLIQTLYNSN